MTNLNISKNIYKKKCTLPFHGTHVTCYIKFKLLYKFIIVTLFSNISRRKSHFCPYIFRRFPLWSLDFIFTTFSPYLEIRFLVWSLLLHQRRKMHTWQMAELKNIKIMSTCHCKLHVAFPPLVSPILACRRSRGPHLTS